MKVYGYVRDENGRFDFRKKSVIECAKYLKLDIDEIIYEDSDGNCEEMKKLRKLLENEKDFILVVSDISDIFEDTHSKVVFLEQLDNGNIFLVDSNYPDFDYKMLIEKYGKRNMFGFFTNNMIVTFEIYTRKMEVENSKGDIYSDIRKRLDRWIKSQ